LRSARTREAIIEALLTLVDGGELSPTVPQIAERAGTSERSIRQHFASRDELLLAGAAKHAERAARLHAPPVGRGSFDTRLDAFLDARIAYLEATSGIRRAAMRQASELPVLRAAIRSLSQERKREVEVAFGPELAKKRGDARDELLEALHIQSSGAVWDALRQNLEMSQNRALEHVRATLVALAS
jgi:AcrR family transcriptional regulator